MQNNGVALWVNGVAVVVNGAASNGAESTLTDFRIRWAHQDNGTWVLDNFVFKRALPQYGTRSSTATRSATSYA